MRTLLVRAFSPRSGKCVACPHVRCCTYNDTMCTLLIKRTMHRGLTVISWLIWSASEFIRRRVSSWPESAMATLNCSVAVSLPHPVCTARPKTTCMHPQKSTQCSLHLCQWVDTVRPICHIRQRRCILPHCLTLEACWPPREMARLVRPLIHTHQQTNTQVTPCRPGSERKPLT